MVQDTVSVRRRSGGATFFHNELRDDDEPTLAAPGTLRSIRRPDRRTRRILAAAVVAAIAVNVGAAVAYWKITSAATAAPAASAAVELTLKAHSDYNKPLLPGKTGNLTITLANDQDFPITIDRVVRDDTSAYADDQHRDGGCDPSGVALTRDRFDVDWSVPKNTIGAFTIPDGLRMAPGAPAACRDATFNLSIQVIGVSRTDGLTDG